MEQGKNMKFTWGDKFWGIIFIIAAIGVAVLSIYIGIQQTRLYLDLGSYRTTDVHVLDSHVRRVERYGGTLYGMARTSVTWEIQGNYVYILDGKEYKQYGAMKIGLSEGEASRELINYGSGATFQIMYHPDNPTKPLMFRDRPTIATIIGLFLFGFVAFSVVTVIIVQNMKEKKNI